MVPTYHPDPSTLRELAATPPAPTAAKGRAYAPRVSPARLLYILGVRNIKLRYTQTIGGFAWAILQPLLLMGVFSLLFSHVLGVQSGSVPYPLYAFAGLVPWTLFAAGMAGATTSLVTDALLIKRSSLPRILLPCAAVIAPMADCAISLAVLLGMGVYWHVGVSTAILGIIPCLALALTFALGLGLWLSAINVEYRDISWALPFLTWMGMLASPVAYGTAVAEASSWYWVYTINPMAGAIEGFRWAVLGQEFPGLILWRSSLVALAVLVTGIIYFQYRQRMFADVV